MAGRAKRKATTSTALAKKPRKKPGPPSKLTQKVHNKILECASLGMKDTEICEIIGISQMTLCRWKQKNQELCLSLKVEKFKADREIVDSLHRRAKGYDHLGEHYPSNPTAAIFWLKNRQPAHWRDKVEVDQKTEHTIVLETGHGKAKYGI